MAKNIEASFTVEIKALTNNLIALARLAGRFSKSKIIQIRVLNSAIELSTQGITKRIDAKTNGEADISVPVSLLKGFLTGSNSFADKKFTFRPGELDCGSSIFSSPAIIVEPVFTNRENVVLPNNLTRIAILRYWLTKTEKELETLQLTNSVEIAKRKMKTDILEALNILNQYDIIYDELEELVKRKIKNEEFRLS